MFSHSDSKSSCEGLRLNLQVGLLTVRALLGAKLTLQQHHPNPMHGNADIIQRKQRRLSTSDSKDDTHYTTMPQRLQ